MNRHVGVYLRASTPMILLCSIVVLMQQLGFAHGVTGADIVGLSSPVEVYRGSVIRVTVYVENTGDEARTFYVGASIIGEGESTWKNLPSWGTTSTISPGSTGSFTFGDYTIPSDAYIGYHGITVKVWTDSTKANQLDEAWYERAVEVKANLGAEITGLDIQVIEY